MSARPPLSHVQARSAGDRRICRRAGGAAAGTPSWFSVTGGLPPELLREASNRLAVVALLCAGGFLCALVLNQIFHRLHWTYGPQFGQRVLFNVAGLLLGLAVFAIARHGSLKPRQFIAVGLGFEILGGLLLVIPEHLILAQRPLGGMVGISWLAVWITFFSAVLPLPPRTTVLTALVTASMSPLGLWIVTWTGLPWPPPQAIAFSLIPNYVVAVLVVIPAIGMYRMRCAVVQARDLGSYRLEERLGQGGMGEVWSASHRLLARRAAIKLISSASLARATGVEVEELIRRFELEAQSTASLSSPHTVALYDFGVTDDGTLYYVMELLQGLDLEKLIERFGPQGSERVVYYLKQICESLDEAHASGLVHRDIKPANVFVSRVGRQFDFVKLLDFGLVKRRHAPDATLSRLTVGEETRGTPGFMPPEMAKGEPLDGRSDLYSVGCLAYWLLTGQLVFEGRTLYEVVSHHLSTPPVPPSTRTELVIPPALEAIVLDCLAKDPADRPANARVLARRLSAVPAAEGWSGDRAETWWRSHLPEFVTSDSEPALAVGG